MCNEESSAMNSMMASRSRALNASVMAFNVSTETDSESAMAVPPWIPEASASVPDPRRRPMTSFNDLICTWQERRWERQSELLRCPPIYDELERPRPLHYLPFCRR